jgi:hypothetical protein
MILNLELLLVFSWSCIHWPLASGEAGALIGKKNKQTKNIEADYAAAIPGGIGVI